MATPDSITIRGAAQHNLKGVDVDLPRNRLTVVTGVSGSGKSSLAFDTLHAEGRHRYMASLSAHARQLVGGLDRPRVRRIDGMTPTLALSQRAASWGARSTMGTATEIYDFMRVLFASVGIAHCPSCQEPVLGHAAADVVTQMASWPDGTRLWILASHRPAAGASLGDVADTMAKEGFLRVRVDGQVLDVDDPELDRARLADSIDVVVDRLVIESGGEARLVDSLETAYRVGDGMLRIARLDEEDDRVFTEQPRCAACDLVLPALCPSLFSFNTPLGKCDGCQGLGTAEDGGQPGPCATCGGTRLCPAARHVRVAGFTMGDLTSLPLTALRERLSSLALEGNAAQIAEAPLAEIERRLAVLDDVGVGYLSLSRQASSLSTGERQRLRLATQLGTRLSGVTYVLDEPTMGLHARDTERLIGTLKDLRDSGNTLVVVEHDADVIRAADHVVELGPGPGREGGHVVFAGAVDELLTHPDSATGAFLCGRRSIRGRDSSREPSGELWIRGATAHNLDGFDVAIPLGVFTVVTGVSGAGKSTLVRQILAPALQVALHRAETRPGPHEAIDGMDQLDRVVEVGMAHLGRTARSNPATLSGVYQAIRRLYANTREARIYGYGPGRFSFNVKGGRCETCQGFGSVSVSMHLLADVLVTCEACDGQRFNPSTLSARYKGCSISDVLHMTVDEACTFFENHPPIAAILRTLRDVGLGYLCLGQPGRTLSGGEAQRIQLAGELAPGKRGRTLYILEEPTTGLHDADVERLLVVLDRLVDAGHTVVSIEHHLDVIASADHIIDLGPEGGPEGGHLVVTGTPAEVAQSGLGHTAPRLAART